MGHSLSWKQTSYLTTPTHPRRSVSCMNDTSTLHSGCFGHPVRSTAAEGSRLMPASAHGRGRFVSPDAVVEDQQLNAMQCAERSPQHNQRSRHIEGALKQYITGPVVFHEGDESHDLGPNACPIVDPVMNHHSPKGRKQHQIITVQ